MRSWGTRILLVLVILVLMLPFVLRSLLVTQPQVAARPGPADQLVIITPHLETVRRKFDRAFAAWYAGTYHRGVNIEYLSFGGGEIVKYFQASEVTYKRSGTYNVDLVWGGSDSLFSDALGSKYLATVSLAPGVLEAAFPTPDIGGVPLYDVSPGGPRWFGAALSSFGIMYNRDVLAYLHLPEPRTWADLADPRYSGWLELADPTRSGSAKAALQVIVEREIATAAEQHRSQEQAWARGMGLIRQIAANAKGFTQAANELPGTVSNGDVAAAMSIDFYARSQIAAVSCAASAVGAQRSDGINARAGQAVDERAAHGEAGGCVGRVGYVEPQGATMVTPEPIAVAKGAQHAKVAKRFIEFVLSDAGQRLWITRPGPGETPEMALQRLPVVRSVYNNPVNFTEFTNPFTTAGAFNTKPSRRAAFGLMDELVALCCIDLLPDLRETRREIVASSHAAELDAKLGTFPVSQAASQAGVDVHRQMLRGKPEDWLTLQRQWRDQFRAEYRELRRAAEAPARQAAVRANAPAGRLVAP
jgi:ABC-type Fe3+ transport system substrate-binding protein